MSCNVQQAIGKEHGDVTCENLRESSDSRGGTSTGIISARMSNVCALLLGHAMFDGCMRKDRRAPQVGASESLTVCEIVVVVVVVKVLLSQ